MTQQYIVESYVFDPVAKTITFPSIPELRVEGVQLITNLTRGVCIYDFGDIAAAGTVDGNVLTLTASTTGMAATDKLQILYNPPSGGFFDRAMGLLYQIVEHLRSPSTVTTIAAAGNVPYQRVVIDNTTSNMAGVTTVTVLSNFGANGASPLDSRELIWTLWDTEYNTGIRSKII